jgi:hypothetical protein
MEGSIVAGMHGKLGEDNSYHDRCLKCTRGLLIYTLTAVNTAGILLQESGNYIHFGERDIITNFDYQHDRSPATKKIDFIKKGNEWVERSSSNEFTKKRVNSESREWEIFERLLQSKQSLQVKQNLEVLADS